MLGNVVKITLIYAATLFVIQFILFIPGWPLIVFPLMLCSPFIIALTALFLTRSISTIKQPKCLLLLSLFLYLFGLIADILAQWLPLVLSGNADGYNIWEPLYPSSGLTLCGLYGAPALVFMAGYLIRLFKQTRAACHTTELTDTSEDKRR